MQAGVDQLGDVVRRDVGGHADRDTRRAIGQQVGELGRQDGGFGQAAIVIVAKIDGVLIQAVEQRLGDKSHPRFGVARGGRIVAVDVAEVALSVDQRITDVEILRQPRHRIIDRGIAMGVEIAHGVARDLGRFQELAIRGQPQPVHRVKNAPVHRFQPVPRIGQGPVHDGRKRIGQVAFAQRPAQGFCQIGLAGVVVGSVVAHGYCVASAAVTVKHLMSHSALYLKGDVKGHRDRRGAPGSFSLSPCVRISYPDIGAK